MLEHGVRSSPEPGPVRMSATTARASPSDKPLGLAVLVTPVAALLAVLWVHAWLVPAPPPWAANLTHMLRALTVGAALTIGALRLARFLGWPDPAFLTKALAFLGAGILEARHAYALMAFPDNVEMISRTAWASAMGLPVLLIVGTLLAPPIRPLEPRRTLLLVVAAVVVVGLGLAAGLVPSFPGGLSLEATGIVSRPATVWTSVIYLVALTLMWRRATPSGESIGRLLLLALFLGMLSQALAAPFWTGPGDGAATLEAVMVLATYLVLTIALLMNTLWRTRAEEALTSRLMQEAAARTKVEAALARQAARLMQVNEELSQFAYVASHDLQEPLRMVTSYLQLIERRYRDVLDDDGREFMGFAVDGAARMKQLTNDLLTYSRVNTRGEEPVLTASAVALDHALLNLQVAVAESRPEIERGHLPEVWADPGQLTQLFQNLVGNALKFRRDDRPPHVRIGATRGRHDWTFTVSDNGIGIDPTYFERVFGVFQRLHGVEAYPGSGIGLAICRKIVERHHGRIWIERSSEQGTVIAWTLPLEPEPWVETVVSLDPEDEELQEQVNDMIRRVRELMGP